MDFQECAAIRRCQCNPILSKNDVPYPAELIFNAGVLLVSHEPTLVAGSS